jgi:hypothetical protein
VELRVCASGHPASGGSGRFRTGGAGSALPVPRIDARELDAGRKGAGVTNGLIGIANDFLAADIAPLGAELSSLRDAAGFEMMTDADPRWWTGHAPLLFPIVGRLAGDRYRLGAAEYALPQHGFARRREFALIDQQASSARFRLEADAETRAVYPFAFDSSSILRSRERRSELVSLSPIAATRTCRSVSASIRPSPGRSPSAPAPKRIASASIPKSPRPFAAPRRAPA